MKTPVRNLSKSKLLAFRQCPKRLWLEVHRPELREDSAASQAAFKVGYQVGDIARQVYDPKGMGVLIDAKTDGFDAAFARTQELLKSAQPIFEAGFRAEGGLAFADVMLPVKRGAKLAWRMVEVKSSTSVKDYHRDDAAIQTFLAQSSGVSLVGVTLAHIDSSWVYKGDGNCSGLLLENDLTDEVFSRGEEVRDWFSSARKIVLKKKPPPVPTGKHCGEPFTCGFLAHCRSQEPQAVQPIAWLPGRLSNELSAHIDANGLIEMRDVPDDMLNERQQRVKAVTLTGRTWFDKAGAAMSLADYMLPTHFLDFETIQFAIPIWKGTRPYQ